MGTRVSYKRPKLFSKHALTKGIQVVCYSVVDDVWNHWIPISRIYPDIQRLSLKKNSIASVHQRKPLLDTFTVKNDQSTEYSYDIIPLMHECNSIIAYKELLDWSETPLSKLRVELDYIFVFVTFYLMFVSYSVCTALYARVLSVNIEQIYELKHHSVKELVYIAKSITWWDFEVSI